MFLVEAESKLICIEDYPEGIKPILALSISAQQCCTAINYGMLK